MRYKWLTFEYTNKLLYCTELGGTSDILRPAEIQQNPIQLFTLTCDDVGVYNSVYSIREHLWRHHGGVVSFSQRQLLEE